MELIIYVMLNFSMMFCDSTKTYLIIVKESMFENKLIKRGEMKLKRLKIPPLPNNVKEFNAITHTNICIDT